MDFNLKIIDIKNIPKKNKSLNKKEYHNEYYKNNKEKIDNRLKEYHKNSKNYKKYYNEYNKEHKEYRKNYYQLNKEKLKEYGRNNHQKNKDYQNEQNKKYILNLRTKIIEKYGSKCFNPYNINHGDFLNDIRCFQIDHVNGNGRKERKEIKSTVFLKKVLADKEGNYQLLCANCNFLKKIINHEV